MEEKLKNKGSFCVFKNILEVVAIMVKDGIYRIVIRLLQKT